MDKCIIAADELTGFIVAAALIRPTKIEGLKAKSVLKKFKTKTFAATVDREEVRKGAELLGWEIARTHRFHHSRVRGTQRGIGVSSTG